MEKNISNKNKSEKLLLKRFGSLTKIQKESIPLIRSGKNVLIVAPTGSGKTEAALLPSLEKVDPNLVGIQILYITPLKSLNRDMLRRFEYWCDAFKISFDVRHGDTPQSTRTKQRISPPSVMIITLETLQALLMGKIIRQHLSVLKTVIVDEIHETLDNKRGAQLSMGLERLNLISNFQRIGMSATLDKPEKNGCIIFGNSNLNFSIVTAGRNRKFDAGVRYIEDVDKRLDDIANVCKKDQVLLFVNTRRRAEELSVELKKRNVNIAIHHGSLAKDIRKDTETNFRIGNVNCVIATSSLELGIDIGEIDLVIQYGSPKRVARFLQRIGRSGHSLNKVPKGIVYTTDDDDYLETESIVARAKTGWMEQIILEKGARDVIAHQLDGLVLDEKNIKLDMAHKILSKSCMYNITEDILHRIALQLDSEGILDYDFENKILKMGPKCREHYYKNLSTIPKTKKYKVVDMSSKKLIAYVDERFIARLEIGTNFVMHGRVWNVGDLTEKEIAVTPSHEVEVVLPEWVGNGIYVDKEIANDVWQLRRAYYSSSKKLMLELPKENELLIELIHETIIIHYPGGSKINKTIGLILSWKLGEIWDERIQNTTDPYRIILKLPRPVSENYIKSILTKNLLASSIKSELTKVVVNSSLMRIIFQNVARLFGYIDENTTLSRRYIKAMKNSIIFEESMRYILEHYIDKRGAESFFNKIQGGEWNITVKKLNAPSHLGIIGINKISKERKSSLTPEKEMYNKFMESVPKMVKLKCLGCESLKVVTISSWKKPICKKCGSDAFYIYRDNVEKSDDKKDYEASLIRNYGKRAVIALTAYGIGVNTAERILGQLHRDDKAFVHDIINAQKRFLNNRRFWKNNTSGGSGKKD